MYLLNEASYCLKQNNDSFLVNCYKKKLISKSINFASKMWKEAWERLIEAENLLKSRDVLIDRNKSYVFICKKKFKSL